MFNATFNMFCIVSYPCLIVFISYLLIYIYVIFHILYVIFDIVYVIYFTLSIKHVFLMYIYCILYTFYILYRSMKHSVLVSYSFTWLIFSNFTGDDTRPAPGGVDPCVHVSDTWECHEAMKRLVGDEGPTGTGVEGPGHKLLLDDHLSSSMIIYHHHHIYIYIYVRAYEYVSLLYHCLSA